MPVRELVSSEVGGRWGSQSSSPGKYEIVGAGQSWMHVVQLACGGEDVIKDRSQFQRVNRTETCGLHHNSLVHDYEEYEVRL